MIRGMLAHIHNSSVTHPFYIHFNAYMRQDANLLMAITITSG